MHILLADDSKASAAPVIRFLESRRHSVSHVMNGEDAVRSFQETHPDLVLMDIVMPVLDGIEATRQIKGIGAAGARWTPVMLLTGLNAEQQIVDGLDAGADDYLTKPIVLPVLEARIRSMQRIAYIQDSLYGILDNVYEGIITIDQKGTMLSFNKAAQRVFGYDPEEVVGRNVKMLMPGPYAQEHDGYLERYMSERTPRIIGIGRKVRGLRKNGQTFPMRLSVTEVRTREESRFIGLVSDITAEEAAREKVEFMAMHDPLTQLPNRAYFNQKLEEVCAAAANGLHAVLFMDLDGFKPVNDQLGHEAGDQALKIVAGRLRGHVQSGDFVARLGGDEFVAILYNLPEAQSVEPIAERLMAAVAEPMVLEGQPARLGVSIGIALLPQHGTHPTDILTVADNAMYDAKRAGKNRWVMTPTTEKQ